MFHKPGKVLAPVLSTLPEPLFVSISVFHDLSICLFIYLSLFSIIIVSKLPLSLETKDQVTRKKIHSTTLRSESRSRPSTKLNPRIRSSSSRDLFFVVKLKRRKECKSCYWYGMKVLIFVCLFVSPVLRRKTHPTPNISLRTQTRPYRNPGT